MFAKDFSNAAKQKERVLGRIIDSRIMKTGCPGFERNDCRFAAVASRQPHVVSAINDSAILSLCVLVPVHREGSP
jgi:hypothetical protein